MTINDFINKLNELKIDYTDQMLDQLEFYCNYLMEYNEHTNLTAIREKEEIYLKHFYDSLMIAKVIDLKASNTLLDIGSGAGFPGVVLKIFYPNLKVTILDSNSKKTNFVQSLINKLELKDINVINERAEEYAKNGVKFDIVTSRAVAYIDIITPLSSYFVTSEGTILLMKGNIGEELQLLEKYQKELNVCDYQVVNCNISENDIRNIIKVKIDTRNIKLLNYSQIVKRHNKWTNK